MRLGPHSRCALVAVLATVAVACGGGTGPGVDEVRLVVSELTPAGGPARLFAGGSERAVVLAAPEHRLTGRRLREWRLRGTERDVDLGRLVAGGSEAALLYHLASRSAAFGDAMLDNRLVRFETQNGVELALLIEPGALRGRDAPASVSTAELPTRAAADLVARAEALGAWQVVVNDRWPIDAKRRPRLPPFVPRPMDDWRALTQRSLESVLPLALGERFRAAPGFRRERNRALAGYAEALPGLADRVDVYRGTVSGSTLVDRLGELSDLLRTSSSAYLGFLDSTWIEMLVRHEPPDTARVRFFVHSVVDLQLDAVYAEIPPKRLLRASAALAGLVMAPVGAGEDVRAHLGKDRIEFRIGRAVAPRGSDAASYSGQEFGFEITGLSALGADAWRLLEALRLQATNRALAAPVPDRHIARQLSLYDARFAAGPEPSMAGFLADAKRVLVAEGAAAATGNLRLEADRRMLVLPAGVYTLGGDFIPPAGYGLRLEAGVQLRIAPGRSLLIRGPLVVRGTAARPVRVRGSKLAEPWGVLAVQGRGRSVLDAERTRSEIAWLELSGGSEDFLKGVHYSGQLSVHHQDLLLRNCVLRHAFADDALNQKYGEVDIRDCVFVDNAADGVDLDWVSGRIATSFFGRSGPGGDGLDLSGSELSVDDSVFSSVRDKCLSVGEASSAVVRGSLFRDCAIAIASKDRSLVRIRESLFLDNERNLAAYEKKPIFGGAEIRAVSVSFVGDAAADTLDARSEIVVEDAQAIAGARATGIPTGESNEETSEELRESLRMATKFSAARYRALRARRP